MTPKIWLPDNQTITVEWYISEGKAVGVNELREEWAAKPLHTPTLGFWTGDPDRDEELPECTKHSPTSPKPDPRHSLSLESRGTQGL